MARALFCWELGGDLGDQRRTQLLANEWHARGHEFAFVFPDLTPLGAPNDASLEWFQAPAIPPSLNPVISPLNASEILLNRGYGDSASVAGALRGWMGLFDLWKPDVVVADYAPGAQIAARAAGIRCVAVGSSFSQPVVAEPMPSLRSWVALDPAALRRLDGMVTKAVRDAFARVDAQARAPETMADVYKAHGNLLCTWPEIDPFGARAQGEYLGMQEDPAAGAVASWKGSSRPRILAYLKPHDPRFAAILESIRSLAGEAIVVAPGLEPARAQMLTTASVRVLAEPLRLPPLLAEADLFVGHGGAGSVERALAAGVALALLPIQLEQYLIGRRVVEAGAGALYAPEDSPEGIRAWLAQALESTSMRAAAQASPLRTRERGNLAARLEQLVAS
jgi:UDP:flavonoid glycosyltransferase YjiC (YdhE family)